MKKKLGLATAVTISFAAFSQNLVKNPEFKPSKKVTGWAQISKAEGWSNANGGTVDIFDKSACKDGNVSIPKNFNGNQDTDGNNYAGIIAFYDDQRVNGLKTTLNLEVTGEKAYQNYAEYLQGELTEGLTAGKAYTFSFKVSLAEMGGRAVKGLGAYFSSDKLAYATNAAIEVQPQIISSELITTTDNWTEVKGTFTAKGGEKYVSIGAFKGSFTTEKTVPANQNDYKKAYYYIYGPSLTSAGDRQMANFNELKEGKHVIFLTLNFETSKSNITTESYEELDNCAKFLNENKDVNIQIDGHTDATGTADVNQKLSEDRSAAVKSYLINKGISSDRMKTAGYGSSRPLESNGPANNPKNRRIELYMIK